MGHSQFIPGRKVRPAWVASSLSLCLAPLGNLLHNFCLLPEHYSGEILLKTFSSVLALHLIDANQMIVVCLDSIYI